MTTYNDLMIKGCYTFDSDTESKNFYLPLYGVKAEEAWVVITRHNEQGVLVELWYLPTEGMEKDNDEPVPLVCLLHPDAETELYDGPSAFPRLRPGRYIKHTASGLDMGFRIINLALEHGWEDADVKGSGDELQIKNADGKFEPFFQTPYVRRRDLTIEAATQYLEQLCAEQLPGYKWATDEECEWWGVFPTDSEYEDYKEEEEEEDLDHYSKEARSVYHGPVEPAPVTDNPLQALMDAIDELGIDLRKAIYIYTPFDHEIEEDDSNIADKERMERLEKLLDKVQEQADIFRRPIR